MTYSGRSVTWIGRMIVRDQDDEEHVLAREPEAGEAVGHERSTTVTAPIVLRTAIATVLNSSRGKLSCVQTVVKFANSRRERPGLGQRPPVALPLDRRRRRIGRVDERALLAALA